MYSACNAPKAAGAGLGVHLHLMQTCRRIKSDTVHAFVGPSAACGCGSSELCCAVLTAGVLCMQVSPRQVYVAAMDWFEHLSRPPSDPAAAAKSTCLTGLRSTSTSESGRSERVKSTFYGPGASEPDHLPMHAADTLYSTLCCMAGWHNIVDQLHPCNWVELCWPPVAAQLCAILSCRCHGCSGSCCRS